MLQHERVTLRPAAEADIEPLLAVLDDPEVTRWWAKEDFGDIVAALDGSDPDATGLIVTHDGQIAGYIQWYEEDDPKYRHAGIDIVLGTGFRGHGVGTTAVRLLAHWLFDERGHHRLVIDPNVSNERAIRTYSKVGFVTVGTLRQYEWDHIEQRWTDGLFMEYLAADRETT